eukprot:m.442397 g.442397  ORF g.442397 m.442397 type:complete len:199 (-) comp18801_c0_seq1:497-1093(-)
MGRTCFITNVLPGKMAEYRSYHDNIWPEVVAGLRASGVTQLSIFNPPGSSTIVMYITTAGDIDLGKATGPGSRYRLDPRCKEWEELMDASFHGGWTKMDEIHSSDVEWNRSLALPMLAPQQPAAAAPAAASPPQSPSGNGTGPAPPSPGRINISHASEGVMKNQLARYEGEGNARPKSPGSGRRGIQPPGGVSQVRFG